jgi:hypothetical protein
MTPMKAPGFVVCVPDTTGSMKTAQDTGGRAMTSWRLGEPGRVDPYQAPTSIEWTARPALPRSLAVVHRRRVPCPSRGDLARDPHGPRPVHVPGDLASMHSLRGARATTNSLEPGLPTRLPLRLSGATVVTEDRYDLRFGDWGCPNQECSHPAVLHDRDADDNDEGPNFTCCAEGCHCGDESWDTYGGYPPSYADDEPGDRSAITGPFSPADPMLAAEAMLSPLPESAQERLNSAQPLDPPPL